MKVKSICLGCKVNAYEIEFIISSFKERGYVVALDVEIADIYVINTCSVTNQSDAKSRRIINHVARENPQAIIVVMGCFIEANKDYNNDNVSIIIGNKDKNRVVELVEEYLKTKTRQKLLYPLFDACFEDMYIKNMNSRTRAFVKIQDGCENFCSYCIIPYTRGKCRSKDKNKVIEEITELVFNGYKEIVLTGIHTGHYGYEFNTSFSSLLKEIIKIPNLERLRISSIEITELDDEFIKLLQNNRVIVSHLHVPLQSGSDTILKLMNRKYDTKYFEEQIKKIREARNNISITTDVIVGFPYETDELFAETVQFIKKIKFAKLHVFPYSRRHGTKADLMDCQIGDEVKKKRTLQLITVSNELEKEYLDTFVNKVMEVLIETCVENVSSGHTGNYIMVKVNGKYEHNSLVNILITKRVDNYLEGEVYEKNFKAAN